MTAALLEGTAGIPGILSIEMCLYELVWKDGQDPKQGQYCLVLAFAS